jgi:CP family cyanate transporter-like MFS transporter
MSDVRTAEDEPGFRASGPDSATPRTQGLPLIVGVTCLCLILIGINLRPAVVSVGPLLPSVRQAFGLSHTEASLLTAIPDVLMGILALSTPWLAHRHGRDRVILAALILPLLATLGRPFAVPLATLLTPTVTVGAGLAIAGALVGAFIKAIYTQRAAFVTGAYAAALAPGSTIAAAASSPLTQAFGSWRVGIGAWAIPGLLVIDAWLFIESRQRRQEGTPIAATQRHRLPLGSGRPPAIGTSSLIAIFGSPEWSFAKSAIFSL